MCSSPQECIAWLTCIQQHIGYVTFFDVTDAALHSSSVAERRKSIAASSALNQREAWELYSPYLRGAETVVMAGTIKKKTRHNTHNTYDLILTSLPRLFYMDISAMEVKGDISFDSGVNLKNTNNIARLVRQIKFIFSFNNLLFS